MSSLATVGGDLTIETTGTGVYDVGGADVTGDTSITTDGYSEVDAATADGQTAVTLINGAATMELVLPAGAFPIGDPVAFSVQQLAADPVESWGEGAVTTLAGVRFHFDIATLGLDATLDFEIDLATLDPGAQTALLDLLHAGAPITLAVQGDAPGAPLQIFGVCATGVAPTPGGCVDVLWLDENRASLEPFGSVDPALLRFEALVGHFSSYRVVLVPEPAANLLVVAAGATLGLDREGDAARCGDDGAAGLTGRVPTGADRWRDHGLVSFSSAIPRVARSSARHRRSDVTDRAPPRWRRPVACAGPSPSCSSRLG